MSQPQRRRPAQRRRKKQNTMLIWVAVAAAVVLIGLVCLLLIPKGEQKPVAYDPNRAPLKPLTVGEYTRNGETLVVDTSYMDVEFPYAFSDLIRVEAVGQGNQTGLAFSATIAGESRELYTLWFNGKDGQTVGIFDPEDGAGAVVVTLVFYNVDAQLQDDDRTTFFATQETVNDVLASMKKHNKFTAES